MFQPSFSDIVFATFHLMQVYGKLNDAKLDEFQTAPVGPMGWVLEMTRVAFLSALGVRILALPKRGRGV